jgi:SAM-dependent methyltransferase
VCAVHRERSRSYLLADERERAAEASRLDRQARTLFPLERGALAAHGLEAGHTVIDLGCGQGTYLELIAASFAGTRCVGLDRHPGLLREARARPGIVAVAECDLAEPTALRRELDRHLPDLVLCRFVLQHMAAAEQAAMLSALAEHASRRRTRVVLADVDAASSFFEPPSALLSEARQGLEALQARSGGDRRIGARLPDLLRAAGFEDPRTSRVLVDSRATGFAAWWSAFGTLLHAGLAARPAAQEALLEWGTDPATANSFRAGFDVCFASSGSVGRQSG